MSLEIASAILTRKGASKVSDIPPEVLVLLNKGSIESVNLTEWLAVDHCKLLKNVLPDLGLGQYYAVLEFELTQVKTVSGMKAVAYIGKRLHHLIDNLDVNLKVSCLQALTSHKSDSVRCWAAYCVSAFRNDSLERLLAQIEVFAADRHFGVREISWLAVRERLSAELELAISHLEIWAQSPDENIRRFAIESIRPRGVWCKHIERLKKEPSLGIPILERLRSDPSKYVQSSVGNWLNDASKSKSDWVIDLCEQWESAAPTKETKRIIKLAKRTIMK